MFDDSTESRYLYIYIPTFVNIRFGSLVSIAAFNSFIYETTAYFSFPYRSHYISESKRKKTSEYIIITISLRSGNM